ncbi:MAG: ATP synthase F1 subunit gamma [Bacteroidales bacterium]|jgi:F-type H+-transporting ATPase subunit gamma
MASLKEVKGRITSVNNTLKITSAMRMISSVKLHRSQLAAAGLGPYQRALKEIFIETVAGQANIKSVYTENRPVKRIAIVVLSSNSSLCGSFNANIEKVLKGVIDEYKSLGNMNIMLFPIGKKISKNLIHQKYSVESIDHSIVDKPTYTQCSKLAYDLMSLFREKRVDRIELIYNHFKSIASQVVTREIFLPVNSLNEVRSNPSDYIFEPGREIIVEELIDKVLSFKIFAIIRDSNAAEHAARTVAMQLASDNASKLIQELTVQYNKTRQQAITNELLDIMGGIAR